MESNHAGSGRGTNERVPKLELLDEIVYRFVENLDARTGTPEFPTGIQVIDEGTYGLHRSHLMVIAGRPGEGKTSLCLQMAYNLAKIGKRVAYFSLEMTKEQMIERLFCNLEGVSSVESRMHREESEPEDRWKIKKSELIRKAQNFGAKLKNQKVPLHLIDDWGRKESEFFHLFNKLKYNPEVIFFDHIQQINPEKGVSKYEALDSYLRYLKELAMEQKIALVVVSQINRQGENTPTIGNLKGCGSIEELADAALLCYQDEEEAKKENSQGNFVIDIAKNRFCVTGERFVWFDKPYFRFLDYKSMLKHHV